MMMILKCYGGQACAEITQAGTGSDAVRETIPISDGYMNSCGIWSVNMVQRI